MTCKACIERGQTWSGSAPQCAFEAGAFSKENWNCATANEIRDLCKDYVYCDDEKYCVLKIDSEASSHGALALWVQWYKGRGRTQDMLLLFSSGEPPRAPTESECVDIIAALSDQL